MWKICIWKITNKLLISWCHVQNKVIHNMPTRGYVIESAPKTHHIFFACTIILLQHIYSNLAILLLSPNIAPSYGCMCERDKPTSDKQVISPKKLFWMHVQFEVTACVPDTCQDILRFAGESHRLLARSDLSSRLDIWYFRSSTYL